MTDNFDFSQHKINLGDTDYPQKHNAAMDALERLGNDTVQRAQEAAHHAAIAAKRVMTKPEFDTIRQNEIRNLLGAGFKKTDFDNDYEFAQVNGWQNKFKLKANEIVIDGVWHRFDDTMIQLHDAPNGLQNIDLTQPDFADIDAAIAAGGTSLSKSYLRQREIVIAIQEDIAVSAANATSMAYIQNANNHVYSVDGQLRQRVLSFVVERLPVSVPMASKHFAYGDARNAMNALGWTETDITGQWSKSGKLGVALTWIERRNQGAGHPMNPDGCSAFKITANGYGGGMWSSSGNVSTANELSECFDGYLTHINSAYDGSIQGNVNNGGTASGRWNSDGKFYDAVYSGDARDLRLNSYKVPDSELLGFEINQAISAKVRGLEAVPFTASRLELQQTAADNTYGAFVTNENGEYSVGDFVWIIAPDRTFRVQINLLTGTRVISWDPSIWGTFNREVGSIYMICETLTKSCSLSAEPTWTDIIGTPANIKAAAESLGVEGFFGTWIPVIPDGRTQTYTMQRKIITDIGYTFTSNNGGAWATGFAAWGGRQNGVTSPVVGTDIYLVNYITNAHLTDSTDNLEWTALSDVYGMAEYLPTWGACLTSSLIGKIPTGESWGNLVTTPVVKYQKDPRINSFNPDSQNLLEHNALELESTGPAVKFVASITDYNGCKAIQLYFKEMRYDESSNTPGELTYADGTLDQVYQKGVKYRVYTSSVAYSVLSEWSGTLDFSRLHINGDKVLDSSGALLFTILEVNGWGDDNKFQNTHGVSTLRDENNNSVKYGTHIFVTNVPAEK